MNNPKLILMDDVHLEGRPEEMRKDFAQKINEQIALIKKEKDIPIVICAGDIGENIEGMKWASQFDADIIYICGNHEFWGGDYDETIEQLRHFSQTPGMEKIHFLHNEECLLHGIRFLGSTLWTSIGNYLPWLEKNYAVRFYGAMGDFKRIKASKWYNPSNEKRLKNYLLKNGVDEEKIKDLIENKLFNPLMEMEENHKSVEFLVNSLENSFTGKTVVVSHHLPCYELWMKKIGVKEEYIQGQWVNNERFFYDSAKGNIENEKDVLMMSFYTNDLKDMMYGELAPDWWLHGHLHQPISDMIGKTHIISSPVGYQRQSKEMSFKIIETNSNRKEFIANQISQAINQFDWNKRMYEPLRHLELLISKFEAAVTTSYMSAYDFNSILENFKQIHVQNLKNLENISNEWLKPFMYNEHPDIAEQKVDMFLVKKFSNILKFSPTFKLPEVLAAAVNEHSFLNEEAFQIANRGGLKFYHYREWLKELQKIQIQISQYKKTLLEFCEYYKNS
jgi:hypothetical protein